MKYRPLVSEGDEVKQEEADEKTESVQMQSVCDVSFYLGCGRSKESVQDNKFEPRRQVTCRFTVTHSGRLCMYFFDAAIASACETRQKEPALSSTSIITEQTTA